ncbi:hypothetical protein OAS86_06955 [Gammaproteobacteria bacterium]|nr:hypothetical protein [Gammaproteobacteria bacterium]
MASQLLENPEFSNGTVADIQGHAHVFYDGYWIRYYAPDDDSLTARRALIRDLTRRTFHHTERGINTPGRKLEFARRMWQQERDPALKRVKAAMLAGALFNRAADICETLVELNERGVETRSDNELMMTIGSCLEEALELGKQVKHYSGHEGIDELWGEPFKAFTLPIEKFYESRYLKIAQSMRDIDSISTRLVEIFGRRSAWRELVPRIRRLADAARAECETMKRDDTHFEVWPEFTVAAEEVEAFQPDYGSRATRRDELLKPNGLRLVDDARTLIIYISGARVPMPKSLTEFMGKADAFAAELLSER